MQFFSQLLNNIQTSSDLLNFIGILLTVIASIYIFKKETSISFIRECHDKLIFPLFNMLEPVLYQEVQPEYLDNALHIIESNKNLADGKLLELFYNCSQNPSQQNFNQLCSYADKLYDKSCRKLGLRIRGISYRVTRHQYKHWSYLLVYALVLFFLGTIIALAFFFASLCLLACLYLIYESADNFTKSIMLLFGTVFVLAFLKYAEKHF